MTGNGLSITDGDTTPSATDGTDLCVRCSWAARVIRTFTITNSGSGALHLTGSRWSNWLATGRSPWSSSPVRWWLRGRRHVPDCLHADGGRAAERRRFGSPTMTATRTRTTFVIQGTGMQDLAGLAGRAQADLGPADGRLDTAGERSGRSDLGC